MSLEILIRWHSIYHFAQTTTLILWEENGLCCSWIMAPHQMWRWCRSHFCDITSATSKLRGALITCYYSSGSSLNLHLLEFISLCCQIWYLQWICSLWQTVALPQAMAIYKRWETLLCNGRISQICKVLWRRLAGYGSVSSSSMSSPNLLYLTN